MRNSDYYRDILLGLVIGASFIALFYMVFGVLFDTKTQSITPKTNAEVVDTYRGCDIIRWTDHQLAEYKYFMDCSKR